MTRTIDLTSDLAVAPNAPDRDALRNLHDRGYRTVVNLRTDGEKDAPLSPAAEGEEARKIGLAYLHFPTAPDGLNADQARELRDRIATMQKPVAIHCASGKRAGVMALGVLGLDDFDDACKALIDAGIDVPREKAREVCEGAQR
jgi:uncharacterized protein (TIGR01244 family)